MRVRSLAGRLAVLQQGLTLAVIVAFAGSSLWLTAHVLSQTQDRFLRETAVRMAHGYEDELRVLGTPEAAAETAVEEQETPGVHVEIADASGRLLARSRTVPGAHGASAATGTLTAAATSESGVRIRVTMSDTLSRASVAALGRSLVISAVPILILSLLLGRGIARRALSPLSAMADRAAGSSIERGVRSLGEPTGLEEIDRLAQSFERLLGRLADALRAERQLTADASHELRTPLTVLSGELEIASEQARGNPPLAAGLATALDQVRAMRELVEAILLLHRSGEAPRVGESEFEPVNLSDLVREAVVECRARYPGRDADVAVEAPDEALVLGHPVLLGSALRNLVDNALKFTDPREPVRVVVDGVDGASTVLVEDGGPGIAAAERDRVFDPFFRGAEARAGGSGFGLGLPLLRRVARAHGGDVTVGTSTLGGARFMLVLPALAGVAEASPPEPLPARC